MSDNIPFGFGLPDEDPDGTNSGNFDPANFNPANFNPGNFDPAKLDMSQLGAMLQQLGRLLESGGTDSGPVNWDLARDTARNAVSREGDPSVTMAEREEVRAAVDLAQVWLDGACTFPTSSADSAAWSRSEWIEGTLPAWQRVIAPIAEQVQAATSTGPSDQLPPELAALLPEGTPPEAMGMLAPLMGMARHMGSAMFGMQVGQGLAALADEVVGVGDVGIPLTSNGRPTLLPRNVAAFTQGLGIPADEVRLYLALRECAQQRLFVHVPWLAQRIDGAVDAYARGLRFDSDRMSEAMREVDPAALSDPSRLQEILGSDLFSLEETPEQQAALARLETLLALIEGWVSDVVEQASATTLPSAERLDEVMRRRRATGGPAERTFASLVGLELRPRALREATTLWRTLRENSGIAGRDALWAHPDLLPTADDLTDPAGFAAGSGPATMDDEPPWPDGE